MHHIRNGENDLFAFYSTLLLRVSFSVQVGFGVEVPTSCTLISIVCKWCSLCFGFGRIGNKTNMIIEYTMWNISNDSLLRWSTSIVRLIILFVQFQFHLLAFVCSVSSRLWIIDHFEWVCAITNNISLNPQVTIEINYSAMLLHMCGCICTVCSGFVIFKGKN